MASGSKTVTTVSTAKRSATAFATVNGKVAGEDTKPIPRK
jgi:hypothetical protein